MQSLVRLIIFTYYLPNEDTSSLKSVQHMKSPQYEYASRQLSVDAGNLLRALLACILQDYGFILPNCLSNRLASFCCFMTAFENYKFYFPDCVNHVIVLYGQDFPKYLKVVKNSDAQNFSDRWVYSFNQVIFIQTTIKCWE